MEPGKVIEYEEALIAVALQHSEGVHAIIDMHVSDFYSGHCRMVAKTIKELWQKNEPIDLVSVSTAMPTTEGVNTQSWRVRLTDLVLAAGWQPSNCDFYVRSIKEAAHLRAFHKLLKDSEQQLAASTTAEPATNAISHHLQQLARLIARDEKQQLEHVSAITADYLSRLREREQNPAEALGADTGLPELNEYTTGLHEGEFIVVGGRPGMGKTSFMLGLAAVQAIDLSMCINFYSLEMSRMSLMQKLIALQSGVFTMKLRTGQGLNSYDWELIDRAVERINKSHLYIADESSGVRTMGDIKAREERQKLTGKKADGDYIDYIQLLKGEKETENRVQEVSQISRDMKQHAAQEGIFVVGGSQLTREIEKRQNKVPQLSDLRESGTLEQDANVVMFIYRDEVSNPESDKRGEADIIIAKQREGVTGTVTVLFDANLQKFQSKSGEGVTYDFTPPKQQEQKKPVAICFPMNEEQLAFEVENGDANEIYAAYEKCVNDAETDDDREIAQRNLDVVLKLIAEKDARQTPLPQPAEDNSPCWYTQM